IGVDVDQKKEGTFIKDQNYFWAQSNDDLLEFLKEDLKNSRWEKAIIEGVPEDKVLILQNWIKKNKGKIEGIEVSIKPTLTGLTVEEEELYENRYKAELDCNRVQLCENEIDKIQRYIDPEYPEEWKPPKLEEKLRWWQKLKKTIYKILRYSDSESHEVFKPPRLMEKLGWWKQMLEKAKAQDKINADRLKRENEASKENIKTAKKLEDALPILEKHSRIGKGPRMHELILDEQIDLFDQGLTERNEGVQQPSGKVLIRFKKHLKEKKEELKNKIVI
ncbi:uncharacterized protein METZ01_LOCUS412848, partial [marine metagenome]